MGQVLLGEHDLCTLMEARDSRERRAGRGGIGQRVGQREHVGQAQMEGYARKRDLARQTHEWEKTHVVDGERQDASPPAAWLGIWEGRK